MRISKRILICLIIALLIDIGYSFGKAYTDTKKPPVAHQTMTKAPSADKQQTKKSVSAFSMDGKKAPNFKLTTLDGNTRSLKAFEGKPLLLVTWATWCKECHHMLDTLQKETDSKTVPFQIVLINMTSEEVSLSDVKQYVSTQQLTMPVLLDQTGEFEKQYHIQVIPTTILMDSYGNVLHTFYGPVSVSSLKNWLPST
jgi:thioredoxin-like negative regulator of GroEL